MRLRWSSKRPAKQFPTRFWNAPLERVSIIEQLVDDSKEATLSPEMLDTILNDFASLAATSSESEAITSTKLHELLYQSIANAEGESSFSMVGEVENYGETFQGSEYVFMEMNLM